jgi:hypothetical protein
MIFNPFFHLIFQILLLFNSIHNNLYNAEHWAHSSEHWHLKSDHSTSLCQTNQFDVRTSPHHSKIAGAFKKKTDSYTVMRSGAGRIDSILHYEVLRFKKKQQHGFF